MYTKKDVMRKLKEMEDYAGKAREVGAFIHDMFESSNKISAVVDDDFFSIMDNMLDGSTNAEDAYKFFEQNGYFTEAGIKGD
jgi:hypothetical protein